MQTSKGFCGWTHSVDVREMDVDFLPAIPLDFAIADAEAKVMSVKLKAENVI